MSIPTTNDEQIAYWNEKAGPKWVVQQERMDAQLEHFSEVVLDHARLWPGEIVLDIGCGCGATTLDAAARVQPDGAAVGADISRPMLERARERARAAHIDSIRFIEADAQTYAFAPGDFDVVISRFGVMFFSDSVVAFANIRRALKPGGRLCFVCWRPMMENPWVTLPLRAAAQHIELPAPPDPLAPGPFAFADADRVRGILERAGFIDVKIEKHDVRLAVGGGGELDRAVEQALDFGPVSALLADKPDDVRRKVRASIKEALKPHLTDEGVVLDWAAWLVSAKTA